MKAQVKDHNQLFREKEYIKQFDGKKAFEAPCSDEETQKVLEWTKSSEYKEKNFARQAVTINPAKACQPLGAVYAAIGFEGTLPFVHGSQGCVAYFRSYLSRHYKEPVPAVSTSMTEDAAVYGGLSNFLEGMENAYAIYKPKMMAVSTTCMAEVIGDDLNAYIRAAREKNKIPQDMLVPYAHTPSFVGSHIVGYDNMMKGILSLVKQKDMPNDRINIIPGFDTYTANIREIKRILRLMKIQNIVLCDTSDSFDSPVEGEYNLYPGGTKLTDLFDAINSKATVSLMPFCTEKSMAHVKSDWLQEAVSMPYPVGLKNTDRLLETLSRLAGVTVPEELEKERGRLLDAMIDSQAYLHGKRFAIIGDPDLVLALVSFCLEVGAYPLHILCTNGGKEFESQVAELLSSSPFGEGCNIYAGKDMWHLRSAMFDQPCDLIIGPSQAKFLWRDTNTPLVRVGFPIQDRHHLHRIPIIGYQGTMNLLIQIVNTVLEELDRNSVNGPNFDLIR